MNARKLQDVLNYKEWRNFHNLIIRAINLIENGIEKGEIKKTYTKVSLGSGAIRHVDDYVFDELALQLIKKLALSFKLGKSYSIRNETRILSLLQKYCIYKSIDYEFQFKLENYIYDFRFEQTLIEFDEPHHECKRQENIDRNKDIIALNNSYRILRFNLSNDIIDIIVALDKMV